MLLAEMEVRMEEVSPWRRMWPQCLRMAQSSLIMLRDDLREVVESRFS